MGRFQRLLTPVRFYLFVRADETNLAWRQREYRLYVPAADSIGAFGPPSPGSFFAAIRVEGQARPIRPPLTKSFSSASGV